jgi:predicted  nucleic acid-binding Zn-ribbon protein
VQDALSNTILEREAHNLELEEYSTRLHKELTSMQDALSNTILEREAHILSLTAQNLELEERSTRLHKDLTSMQDALSNTILEREAHILSLTAHNLELEEERSTRLHRDFANIQADKDTKIEDLQMKICDLCNEKKKLQDLQDKKDKELQDLQAHNLEFEERSARLESKLAEATKRFDVTQEKHFADQESTIVAVDLDEILDETAMVWTF